MTTRPGVSSGITILVAIVLALLAGAILYFTVFSSSQGAIDDTGQAHEDTQDEIDEQRHSLIRQLEQAIQDALSSGGLGNNGGGPGSGDSGFGSPPSTQPGAVTVAFIGDQGLSSDAREVLQLIRNEGADLVVHPGDIAYAEDDSSVDGAQEWKEMVDDELGPNFPYIAVIGNHELSVADNYLPVIDQWLGSVQGLECTGDLGLQFTCSYNGVLIVSSPTGLCYQDYDHDANPPDAYPELCGSNGQISQTDQEAYVRQQLSSTDAVWRICSWHKNHQLFQTGDKPSAVPLSMYDACREGGAIVATAHEHSYARTHQMNNFANQDFVEQTPLQIGGGSTFAFVSALGGQSSYPPESDRLSDPWWAETVTGADDPAMGAFFCAFNPDGTGNCYFKNIDGETIDPFEIQSTFA